MAAFSVNRFVCPALAVVTAIVALWGQWFTRTTSITNKTIDSTLLEVIQGKGIVEYTSTRWIWLWAVGVILVVASAAVNSATRKKMTQTGAFLMIALPGWSLFNVYAEDSKIGAGWGLFAVAVLTVAIIVLATRLPDEAASPTYQMDTDGTTIG